MKQEAGWEFTLPGYFISPFYWVLTILIIIALILSLILVVRIAKGQNKNQAVIMHTVKSP